MRIGLFVSAQGVADLDAVLSRFETAERRGLHTAWVGQVLEHDALTLLALASRTTRRIELGTWVVPTYPRHPSALAQQALTVQLASGGRLALGIGASHRAIVEKKLGLDYSRPLRHVREYLAALRPLLAGEFAKLEGEEFRLSLALESWGLPPPPIILAALGPKMLHLAGGCADGAAIWLGGPRFLEDFAIPRILAGAREAARPAPRILAGLPVAVSLDASAARASAEQLVARSAVLPAYRRVLEREGAESPGAVAIVGDAPRVERELVRLSQLGVTDFNAVVFPVAGDPDAPARTLDLLADLARRAPTPAAPD